MGFGSTSKVMHSAPKSQAVNCKSAPSVRVDLRSCDLREPKSLQSNEEKRKERKEKEPPCKSRIRRNVGRNAREECEKPEERAGKSNHPLM